MDLTQKNKSKKNIVRKMASAKNMHSATLIIYFELGSEQFVDTWVMWNDEFVWGAIHFEMEMYTYFNVISFKF